MGHAPDKNQLSIDLREESKPKKISSDVLILPVFILSSAFNYIKAEGRYDLTDVYTRERNDQSILLLSKLSPNGIRNICLLIIIRGRE